MIIYLLAIASPTHAVSADLYCTGMGGRIEGGGRLSKGLVEYGGRRALHNGHSYEGSSWMWGWAAGGPLFFAHYSLMGFDPHFRDRYYGLFREQPQHALINLNYCVRNPKHYKDTEQTAGTYRERRLVWLRRACSQSAGR